MYGDRDIDVNCKNNFTFCDSIMLKLTSLLGIGGEQVSLAINHSSAAQFEASGYKEIAVNSSYIGGMTRQHGGFSFSRVYEAGNTGM